MAIQQYPQPTPDSGIPSGDTAGRPAAPVIGDTYYNGELELLEIYNGSEWVASSAPPATPNLVSVTDVGTDLPFTGGGTFTVVLTPGSGGAVPTQYNVSAIGGSNSVTSSSSSSTVSLTGLTPNTSFSVFGNAQNGFGVSTNSFSSGLVLATTAPETPTIGTLSDPTPPTGNTLELTFTAGATGGKSITNYKYSLDDGATYTAFSPAQTTSPLTISGLTAGVSYTVRLKAVNANGDSPQSAASNSVTTPVLFDTTYLVVAGGGAGGQGRAAQYAGGGGGAGGYRTGDLSLITATNYTVTVGAGGASAGSQGQRGSSGSNSVFSTITSAGGGGGGGADSSNGALAGGSGGGGGFNGTGTDNGGAGNTPSTSPSQGFAGGANVSSNLGGGGGGAGEAGNTDANSEGGDGVASSITGSSVTRAGGGAGVDQTGATGGTGGGASNSGWNTNGNNGTVNTGGGGSGSGGSTTYPSGAGGSGVVILKYPDTRTITIGAGLTGSTASPSGGFIVTTITAGSGNVSWA
jgi:hypothetical protein